MLLCFSKIPVRPKFTVDTFVRLAIDWVLSKRHYRFDPFLWNRETDFIHIGKNKESFQVRLFEDGKVCAVHFISFGKIKKQPVQWTTDFILDTEDCILAFQLYCDDLSGSIEHFPRSLPGLIESIISSGYCAIDHNIRISGAPISVGDEDTNWIIDLMLHKIKYALPLFIYLSMLYNLILLIRLYLPSN